VKGVHSWGVFVEVLPGREGLVHVSELDTVRVSITCRFSLFLAWCGGNCVSYIACTAWLMRIRFISPWRYNRYLRPSRRASHWARSSMFSAWGRTKEGRFGYRGARCCSLNKVRPLDQWRDQVRVAISRVRVVRMLPWRPGNRLPTSCPEIPTVLYRLRPVLECIGRAQHETSYQNFKYLKDSFPLFPLSAQQKFRFICSADVVRPSACALCTTRPDSASIHE
jgi:hypothetical protein